MRVIPETYHKISTLSFIY